MRVASLQPLRHTLASHGEAAATTQTREGRQSPGAQHVEDPVRIPEVSLQAWPLQAIALAAG